MRYERGSLWRKWDLHIHTPNSMVNFYEGANSNDKWERFITELESLPEEFKVIGINDYLFIDGYEKVLEFKKSGRLTNIETIFPIIEFRLKKFAGNRVFKRINFHVIFSDKLSVDIIKQQFLNQLYGKHHLAPGLEGIQWGGIITPESLSDLGNKIRSTVPVDKLHEYGSDLAEGFNNINFDEDEIIGMLNKSTSYLKDHYLTAIGKTEWADFQWNDNSIAEKKSVINKVHFVFTSAETIDAFNNAKKKLEEEKVNHLLLDCSDAHRNLSSTNKDRLGKCFTWVKADPTFEGLKQVINEPERVCIIGTPEQVQRVATSPNKFINEVSIRRTDGCNMPEIWYDNLKIKLNPSLVAIIGNKGNGKSALTDIIGLVGNSYNTNYSFLTRKKFRNPQPYNKASNIEAQLTWCDNSTDGYTLLNSDIDLNKIEKVKYIPQNFLETLCVNEDETGFEDEIKKIIFSHTPSSERMGFSSLDELITYKSEVINKELGNIKGEIDDLNLRIINLERKTQDNFRISVQENLAARKTELENHKQLKPQEVQEPKNDPALEERNRFINSQIIEIKSAIDQKLKKQIELIQAKSKLLIDTTELEKSLQVIKSLVNTTETARDTQKPIFEKYGLNIDSVIQSKFDLRPLETLLIEKKDALNIINSEVNGDEIANEGIETQIERLRQELSSLEDKLDEPYRIYQKYLKDLEEWNTRQTTIIGDKATFGTISYLEEQLEYLEKQLTNDLNSEIEKRNALLKKLFSKKSELISLYTSSYRPITDFITSYGHMMKDYAINLSTEFTLDGFAEKFFDHVSQGARGTYIGVEEGNRYLSDLIPQYDLNNVDKLIAFLSTIRESLFCDKRSDQQNAKRDIENQLKKGYTVEDLYRFLFNLDYLKPTFRLNLGNKTLSELSPGERGALLLIFYLFLDKDDKPLIIDQPEENLDNQSVYHYLVHFIKEAKKRRQIIIVTHNPNLAVVCDAEQIIQMTIDKGNNQNVSFKSGSIENPIINKAIVDILEGTQPAFNNRTNKYSLAKG